MAKFEAARAPFLEAAKLGCPIKTCCKLVGIAENTFYYWRKIAREDPECDYAVFMDDLQSAQGQGELNLIKIITKAADTDWKAATWIVERRVDGFQRKDVVKHEVRASVVQLLGAVEAHMSRGAYGELISAIATAQGLDADETAELEGEAGAPRPRLLTQ